MQPMGIKLKHLNIIKTKGYKMENEERLCDCGNCRYCNAYLSSEYDYDEPCSCNGAGCTKCEE
jgi:hypothetical protein